MAALHLLLGGGGEAGGVGLALAEGRAIATPIDWPVIMQSLAARGASFPEFADLGAAHAAAPSPGMGAVEYKHSTDVEFSSSSSARLYEPSLKR